MNNGFDYSERIGTGRGGATVLDHLAGRWSHTTPEEWARRIDAGQIDLDGHRVAPGCRLQVGQVLRWRRPPWREPDVPRRFGIVHEDHDLLAVAKPAGLPTVPAGGFLDNTLLALVRERDPEATPMHRLGRWTSGLVLFARNRPARSSIAAAWRAGRVVRRYRALAVGRPAWSELAIDTPIGPVPYPPLGTLHAAVAQGRPSRTEVRRIEQRADTFLAEVTPHTGRPHQIRIHLASAGHPLSGDPLYTSGGRPIDGGTALPGDPGYLLHACRLTVPHPRDGRMIALDCAPPASLRAIATGTGSGVR